MRKTKPGVFLSVRYGVFVASGSSPFSGMGLLHPPQPWHLRRARTPSSLQGRQKCLRPSLTGNIYVSSDITMTYSSLQFVLGAMAKTRGGKKTPGETKTSCHPREPAHHENKTSMKKRDSEVVRAPVRPWKMRASSSNI